MKELHKILTDNVFYDKGINVTIDKGIPKTTIRITQSTTMILYGIGKQNEPGFTLYISIDNKSNKGKRIIEELTKEDTLKEFKVFDEKRYLTYVFDFKMDIGLIINKTYEVLDRLKMFSRDIDARLIVNKTNQMHTLK